MADVLFKEESYRITGACFEVYKDKGCGYHEPVYHECLIHEFRLQGIPAISKPCLQLEYKGHQLEQKFEPDFVCFGKIIVELKAVAHLNEEHRAQVMNYLKATNFKLGIIANFGHYPRLETLRVVADDRWTERSTEQLDLRG